MRRWGQASVERALLIMHLSAGVVTLGASVLRKLRRSILWAVMAFVLAIVLSNCNNPSKQISNSPTPALKPAVAPAGALVYGAVGQPVNLEPGNITDGNSTIVQHQIYNRLI